MTHMFRLYPRLWLFLIVFVTLARHTMYAQPSTPDIDTARVGWGWFDLRMTGQSAQPRHTQWLINESASGVTVFNSLRDCAQCPDDSCRARCIEGVTADERDLDFKRILGCIAGMTYTAKVRYHDGTDWSAFSTPITFTTPAEPEYFDTVRIVLWGHSTLTWSFNTGVETLIREGDQGVDGFSAPNDDSFGHALQTELRRITGKRILIVNRAMAGTRQSRWLRSGVGGDVAIDDEYDRDYQHLDSCYENGGSYADHAAWPIAVFMFGQNDARAGWCEAEPWYPVEEYEKDVRNILRVLGGTHGVSVVYNSVHYAFPHNCENGQWEGAPFARQVSYFNAWRSLMDEYRNDPTVVKGVDFFSLFQSDTGRYLCLDRIHPNLSEGIPGIVEPLAIAVKTAIHRIPTAITIPNDGPADLSIDDLFPQPVETVASLRYSVANASSHADQTFTIRDILGRVCIVRTVASNAAGVYEFRIDAAALSQGVYNVTLECGNRVVSRSFLKR